MAITTIQHGNDLDGSLYYPHSCNYPAFFTCSSTDAANYYDFKYLFRVYDSTGLIYETYKVPSNNLLGVFNPSKITKSYISSDLSATEDMEALDYQFEYRVTVEEYFDGALIGTEVEFDKSLAGNLTYNFTDSKIPYVIENNKVGEILTNQTPDIYYNQSLNTFADWVFTTNTHGQSVDYVRYEVKYFRESDSREIRFVYSISNPSTYSFLPGDATVNSASTSTYKFPVGFGNLREATVDKVGWYESDGTYHATPLIGQAGIDSNVDEEYTRVSLSVSLYEGSAIVSEEYNWNLIQCNNKDVSISWINSYGGIDFFNFNKIRTDVATNERNSYMHNSFEYSSNKIFNSTSRTNVSTYENNKEYLFGLKTDLLGKHEIELLKGFWLSEEIGLYLEDVLYPITSITNTQEIRYKEIPEFIMYIIQVAYSKIMI
jgi:hypothetical protein